jgi:hypothetical protein
MLYSHGIEGNANAYTRQIHATIFRPTPYYTEISSHRNLD